MTRLLAAVCHHLNSRLQTDVRQLSINALRLITHLFAGALLPLAFSPYGYHFLAILMLTYFFYMLANSNLKHAVLSGYFFGLGMFGTGISWLNISIHLFGNFSVLGAWALTLTLVAFLSLYTACFAYLVCCRLFAKRGFGWFIFIMPTMWVLLEWLRSWLFGGFTWLSIGYSQIDTPISALTPIFGLYGVSWMTAFLSALLAAFFLLLRSTDIGNRQVCKIGAVWLVLLVILGLILQQLNSIRWTIDEHQNIAFVIVQGAISQSIKWQPQQRQKTVDHYLSLSEQYPNSDLIIWPETAIPDLYHQADDIILEMTNRAKAGGHDYLVGLPIAQLGKAYNAMAVIGSTKDVYYKRHLVPFGEYLPFDSWLRPLTSRLDIPMPNFSVGESLKPIVHAANIVIGVSICYEDIFGAEIMQALPEAKILVNISNDAWFGDSIAPHQHLQMARMRALEAGRYMLRATNTGVSAVINEKGLIIARLPQFVPHAISQNAALFSGMTPYAKFGNSLIIIPMTLLLILSLFFRIISRKRDLFGRHVVDG